MTQCTEKASANYKQVLKKLQLSLSKQGSHCKLQKRCSNVPYKQAGKTTKSFSQQCCADEQGTSGCSQSSNQLAQHGSQSCDVLCEADPLLWVSCEQQDAMKPLGLEKPRVSELCSDLQPSPNKCLLPKITSERSGCDWLCLWHCHQCQILSYMELGLTLPPLTLRLHLAAAAP